MSDTPTPSLAGDAGPSSAAPTTSILDALGDADFGKPDTSAEDEGQEEAEPVEIEEAPEPEPSEDDTPDGDEDEEPSDDADEPKPKPTPSDDDETGARMHRLRDGTQVSLADLKRGFDRARELEQRVIPQVQQEAARLQHERQALAAQHQQFQPVLAQVATILQQQVPPMPDPSLIHTDPIEFHNQRWMHEQAVSQLRAVNQAHAEATARQQQEQQAQQQAYLQEQQRLLVQAIPVLREPEKAKAFNADYHEVGQYVGFSQQELGQVHDHRLFKLAELAAEGLRARKEAGKAKQVVTQKAAIAAKKVADKPPVQAPAARQSASTREAVSSRGQLEKLAKTGSPRVAEDFLSRFA